MADEDRIKGAPRVVEDVELFSGFARLNRVVVEIDWQGAARRFEREIHWHGHVAALLPVDPARRTGLLLRQFRTSPFLDGVDPWLWEIPAGLIGGEPPEDCARRETAEEAGVNVAQVAPLGSVWTSPGALREQVHLFWGVYAGPPPAATGGLDHEDELIEVHELPLADIARHLDRGDITDAKTALALHCLRAQRPDLFAP